MTNKQKVHVLILAAGKGTRMGGDKSKVLYPVGGAPMITHVLDTAKALNPESIHILISHGMEEVISLTRPYPYIIQQERLGTGHAVQTALPFLPNKGSLLVLYGDTPLIKKDTLNALLQKPNAASVLGFHTAHLGLPYGRIHIVHNMVHGIIEYHEADDTLKHSSLCNAGMMLLDLKICTPYINTLPLHPLKNEYYLTDIPAVLHQQGHTVGYSICDETEALGANTLKELSVIEAAFQDQKRANMMLGGVMMPAPHTVHFQYDTKIGSTSIIDPFVVFGQGVIVDEGVHIKAFSHIEGTHLKKNTHVGPFVRLRPQTTLEEGVHLGNFVEVKNSLLGKHSKAGHLTYLGDSTIGDHVNIGAGTVTCNYDGTKKHQTCIEDKAFIGSNTALIAPVTVGKKALVAAGSTITHNVPPHNKAFARTRQINKKPV
jgi:bifunctional UDP-N-acetylglucosamine pyrophosphorylase / glucosamine-1-phosphate N-acetyltransferase